MDTGRAREALGYDDAWDRAGVLDEGLLAEQATALAARGAVHPEHARWAMWCAYAARRRAHAVEDDVLERLLALDTSEAAKRGGFGHGIVLQLLDLFVLTEVQLARIATHPVEHGLSGRTRAIVAAKIERRRGRLA